MGNPVIEQPDSAWQPATCDRCNKPIARAPTGRPRRFCSKGCGRAFRPMTPSRRARKRADKVAARAKAMGCVVVEVFDPHEVFAQDQWTCQECRRPTPEALAGSMSQRAPCLDHRVALCHGGEHSRANARCLCRRCNQAKGTTERRGTCRSTCTSETSMETKA